MRHFLIPALLVSLLAGSALPAHAQMPALRWDVQQADPKTADWYIYRGESVELMPRLIDGTQPAAITNTPATLRYREPTLPPGQYREAPATNVAPGTWSISWSPELDAGALWYAYQLWVGEGSSFNNRIAGKIIMRESIGIPPAGEPPPPVAGYATEADIQAALASLAAVAHSGSYRDLTDTPPPPPLPPDPAAAIAAWAPTGHVASADSATTANAVTGPQADLIYGAVQSERDPSALRLYHYGSSDIVESLFYAFQFNAETGTITQFTGLPWNPHVVIPWQINGVPVRSIGQSAFDQLSGLLSVIAPRTLTHIESDAFVSCASLAYVSLPAVTNIGNNAFIDCPSLTTVSLPAVATIGVAAFAECTNLTDVDLHGVASVGKYGFIECSNLTNITFTGDAPSFGASALGSTHPDLKIYVTNPAATGWPAEVQGVPVVRLPLHTDALTLGGDTRSTWPEGISPAIVTNIATDVATPIAQSAADTIIQTYFVAPNAWLTVSNDVFSVWHIDQLGSTNMVWASTQTQGSLAQEVADLRTQVETLSQQVAMSVAWGDRAPDGTPNPDPSYMVLLNRPATMHMSGYQWQTYGTYAVLTSYGTTAFETGTDGALRIGPDAENYFGYTAGGSVIIGAIAQSFWVNDEAGTEDGLAYITYPYSGGDWPVLWYSPTLRTPFAEQSGVVWWTDNADGTATVAAPATAPGGYWRATTSTRIDNIFTTTMPAWLQGGILTGTNSLPVIYDTTITIQAGGAYYRIPAETMP